MRRPDEVLSYWFEGLNDSVRLEKNLPVVKKWFTKSEVVDREIREAFEETLLLAEQGSCKSWEKEPRGVLALVILFDQLSRNMYRGASKMFSFDQKALDLTLQSIDGKTDEHFLLCERIFLYMPLMHAEDLKIQELSLKYFGGLVAASRQKSQQNLPYYEYTLDYAQRHHDIVLKFGRFPHRNKILNRLSTSEEEHFLKTPNSSF